MSSKIGALSVDLSLQTEGFLQGLKDSQKETAALVKEFKPLTTAFKETGEAMSVVGDVIAVGMFEAAEKTAQYGAELQHLHEKSGASIEDLSGLGFAAIQHGSSIEGLGTSLKFLSKNMELAENGSKAQGKAFDALGITEAQLNATHGSSSAAFALLADRISGMEDPSVHAADLTKILGKSWTEMIPTLMLGSEGLEAARKQAEYLGIVLSGEAAEAGLKFEQSVQQVSLAIKGLALAIGSTLIPVIQPYIEKVVGAIVEAKDFIKAHDSATIAVFGTAVAIGGTGGLLLALSSLGFVYPLVVSGFELVGHAAEAMAAKIGTAKVAVGVFGAEVEGVAASGLIAGMATGLESVGIAAVGLGTALTVLTTGALVAIAAEIGFIVGSIINWGLKVTGLQSTFDDFVVFFTSKFLPILGDYLNGQNAVKDATALSSDVQKTFAARLEELGIEFDKTKLGNSAYVASLGEQIKAMSSGIVTTQMFTDAGLKFQIAQEKMNESAKALKEEQEKQKKAVDALVESVIPATDRHDALNAAIVKLTGSGYTINDLMPRMGKGASEMASAYDKAGLDVGEAVRRLAVTFDFNETLNKNTKQIADWSKTMSEIHDGLSSKTTKTLEEISKVVSAGQHAVAEVSEGLASNSSKALEAASKKIGEFQAAMDQAATGIMDNATKAREKAEKEAQKAAEKAADALEQEAHRMGDAMASAMTGMTAQVSDSLAGMIVHGRFSFDSLINIAQSTAQRMLSAFLDGLMSPLTNALAKLGNSIGDTISNALNIGGGTGSLGTKSVIGTIGTAGADVIGGAIGSSAGGAATSVGGSLISGFATAGIGAGIGLAIAGITSLVKNMDHFKANELVKNFQAPFDMHFAEIINSVAGALTAGELTPEDAQQADNDMYTLWKMASSGVDSWAVGDSGKEKVRDQFHQTEDVPTKGWLDWIDSIAIGMGGKKGSSYTFATGIDRVPFDMIAQIHKDEMIIPAAQNPANRVYGDGGWKGAGMTQAGPSTNQNFEFNFAPGARVDENWFVLTFIPMFKRAMSQNTRDLATTVSYKVNKMIPGLVSA